MKKSLFKRVTDYVNSVGAGNEFKVSSLISEVGPYVNITRHNSWNNNPYYRVRTYVSYLRRIGILSHVKYGVWKINYDFPAAATLTDVEFALGYRTKCKWNSETRTRTCYPTTNNPFDFAAYFAAEDHPTVHSGAGTVITEKPTTSFETKIIFVFVPATGVVKEVTIPKTDMSFKTNPFCFESLDAVLMLYPTAELESDIAENQFEAVEEEIAISLTERVVEPKTVTVKSLTDIFPVQVGDTIYTVSECGNECTITKEKVTEVIAYFNSAGVTFEVCTEDNSYGDSTEYFLTKDEAATRLLQLV